MVKCGAGGHAASKLESFCITTLYIHCQYRAPPNSRRRARSHRRTRSRQPRNTLTHTHTTLAPWPLFLVSHCCLPLPSILPSSLTPNSPLPPTTSASSSSSSLLATLHLSQLPTPPLPSLPPQQPAPSQPRTTRPLLPRTRTHGIQTRPWRRRSAPATHTSHIPPSALGATPAPAPLGCPLAASSVKDQGRIGDRIECYASHPLVPNSLRDCGDGGPDFSAAVSTSGLPDQRALLLWKPFTPTHSWPLGPLF